MSTTVAALAERKTTSVPINVALWIAQVILFVMFLSAGIMKSTQPIEALAQSVPWTAEVPLAMVRFIGVAEFLGALGVLLPALARIKPALTPLAALGLVVVMVLAIGFHITRAEYGVIGIPFALGALAAFVAWGRYRKAPIAPRS